MDSHGSHELSVRDVKNTCNFTDEICYSTVVSHGTIDKETWSHVLDDVTQNYMENFSSIDSKGNTFSCLPYFNLKL